MGHERSELQSRKFYSQRNMYLCGFTLFLSLILNRTYIMILDTLRLEEKVKRMEGDPKASGKDASKLDQAGQAGELHPQARYSGPVGRTARYPGRHGDERHGARGVSGAEKQMGDQGVERQPGPA